MKNVFVSHLRRSTFFRYAHDGMFCFFVHILGWVELFVFALFGLLGSQFPFDFSNIYLVELSLV